MLTTAITTPIYGKMADLYGRKIVFYYREPDFFGWFNAFRPCPNMGQLILLRDFSEHDLFPSQVNRGG
ncbi:hypothetical protein [Paenibacillus larvae]|uniref:hypothetical protein n=1 Tax=Paenibacillus larvae TaxID=1464 RepID=UPI0035A5AABD